MSTTLKLLAMSALVAASVIANAQTVKLQFTDFATGFSRPVDIAHAGDSRMFVVEQRGKIWVVDSLGVKSGTPFLDIESIVNDNGNEQGLLGLAFHPNYAQNGYFYVSYIRTNSNSRIARYSRSATDPNLADPASEKILLDVTQPYSNHNGGCLKFGPNGYLYASFGDGGSGNDPQGNGQKKTTHLGKILRLDVNNENAPYYNIPPGNASETDAAFLPEIWSTGWRNPWRFSFDRLTGDMWVGEVGQNAREEIVFESATAPAGLNYGWRCYEGNIVGNSSGCQPASNYVFPIYDYPNPSKGCSVTGGFVYRGSQYENLYGAYIFADYCSGRWWITRRNADGTATTTEIADLSNYEYSAFGEDKNGNLYVAGLVSGKIMKVNDLCSSLKLNYTTTPATCPGATNGSISLNTTGGTSPYTYTWSGGTPANPGAVPGGFYYVTVKDANNCTRNDTILVESDFVAVADILPPTSTYLCEGQSVTLTCTPAPAGFGYQWANEDMLFMVNQPSLTVTTPGLYTVQLIDSTGVCIMPESGSVLIEALPKPQLSLPQGSNVLCPGTVLTIESTQPPAANGPFSYIWFSSAVQMNVPNQPTLQVTEPGVYSVQWVNAAANCYSGLAQQLTIFPDLFTVPDIELVGGDTLTVGATVEHWLLNGQIIPNSAVSTWPVTETGTYSCRVTSPNGCTYLSNSLFVEYVGTLSPELTGRILLTPNPGDGRLVLSITGAKQLPQQVQVYNETGQLLETLAWPQQGSQFSADLSRYPAGQYRLILRYEGGTSGMLYVKR